MYLAILVDLFNRLTQLCPFHLKKRIKQPSRPGRPGGYKSDKFTLLKQRSNVNNVPLVFLDYPAHQEYRPYNRLAIKYVLEVVKADKTIKK